MTESLKIIVLPMDGDRIISKGILNDFDVTVQRVQTELAAGAISIMPEHNPNAVVIIPTARVMWVRVERT